MQAILDGEVIAESVETVVVEGNHYFPPSAVKAAVLRDSELRTVCPWKGTASYHTLEVNGSDYPNAAWYYPEASEKASNIEGYIAFGRPVEVTA